MGRLLRMSRDICAIQKENKLLAENRRLRKALQNMLYLFDRGLTKGTIGRQTCDEAKEALKIE